MATVVNDRLLGDLRALAGRYGARKVVLFGSCLEHPERANDIDLGVKGLPPGSFFAFYGEVLGVAPCSVDIVDLDQDSLFSRLVERDGRTVYEHA